MCNILLVSLCLCLCLPFGLLADGPVQCRAVLLDGSIIVGTLKTDSIHVVIPYGSLVVPSSELRTIHFGLHLSLADAKAIALAIKTLDSPVHRERDLSDKLLLQYGRRATLMLQIASRSKDAERARRAKSILDAILDGGEKIPRDCDTVTAREMTVRGSVRHLSVTRSDADAFAPMFFEITSKSIGDLKVSLTEIAELRIASNIATTVKVDAASFGDKWLDTGVQVDNSEGTLVMKASGTVDLYPNDGLRVYVTRNPDGYNTQGKGGRFPAGSLVGKIGDGDEFRVGESYSGATKASGRLYLRIIPSPWNNISDGVYSVDIRIVAN